MLRDLVIGLLDWAECAKAAVFNLWVTNPLGVTYQLFYISDIYVMIYNSSKMK